MFIFWNGGKLGFKNLQNQDSQKQSFENLRSKWNFFHQISSVVKLSNCKKLHFSFIKKYSFDIHDPDFLYYRNYTNQDNFLQFCLQKNALVSFSIFMKKWISLDIVVTSEAQLSSISKNKQKSFKPHPIETKINQVLNTKK